MVSDLKSEMWMAERCLIRGSRASLRKSSSWLACRIVMLQRVEVKMPGN